MNLSLFSPRPLSSSASTRDASACGTPRTDAAPPSESAQIARLWSLLGLLGLYATALLAVMLVSDGPDIGCILMGIAGHVLYASGKTAIAWREASWLELARARVRERRLADA